MARGFGVESDVHAAGKETVVVLEVRVAEVGLDHRATVTGECLPESESILHSVDAVRHGEIISAACGNAKHRNFVRHQRIEVAVQCAVSTEDEHDVRLELIERENELQ